VKTPISVVATIQMVRMTPSLAAWLSLRVKVGLSEPERHGAASAAALAPPRRHARARQAMRHRMIIAASDAPPAPAALRGQ
jgi:hypothetical protein